MPANPNRTQLLQSAFEAGLHLTETDRTKWVLAQPSEIRAELQKLFDQTDGIGNLLRNIPNQQRAQRETKAAEDTDQPEAIDVPKAGADTRLFGSIPGYEILNEISRGGMGIVWRARQTSLNRLVAVKQMQIGRLASAADHTRFQIEAEAVATLNHPGIVQIFEVADSESGPWFSMELVNGCTLSEFVRQEKPSAVEAARLIAQIADAVQYAHTQGVLHRDLKPANVLITENGRTKLTDFGLARMEATDGPTLSGQLLGTPAYMSPEQATADSAAIGPATDVYGLGAILYFTLTGQSPFANQPVTRTLELVCRGNVVIPRQFDSSIPTNLEAICMKAMQKKPADRYETAELMRNDLQRFLNHEPTEARPQTATQRLRRRLRPLFSVKSMAAMLLLVAAAKVAKDEVHQLQTNVTSEAPAGDREAKDVPLVVPSKNVSTSSLPLLNTEEDRYNRMVAVELVKAGVNFGISAGGFRLVTQLDEIPSGSFRITVVNLMAPTPPKTLDLITQLRRLQCLNSHGVWLSDQNMASLNGIKTLNRLAIASDRITIRTLGYLTESDLTILHLAFCSISNDAVPYICDHWPNLQRLSLGYTPTGTVDAINDDGVRHLTKLKDLSELTLQETEVTDASIPVLSSLAKLKLLDLRDTLITEQGISALKAKLPACKILSGAGE